MYIEVCPITEDTVDFDEEYSFIKDSLSSLTLVNAEKLPESNGIQHMHFQAKNKEEIVDLHEYYAKNYKYLVSSLIKINDDTSTKDMILSLVDSFKIGKIDNETYDLSTVKTEGTRQYREITDDTYKVSFYVPADYQMDEDNPENEFTFFDPENESKAHISLSIYSKTGDTTAYSLATHDHAIREKYASTKYSTLTPVSETGNNSYKYTQTISGSTNSDLSNQSSETLVFSRKIGILILVPYVFSLVFALMSRNKGNFLFRFPRPPYQAVLRKFVSLPS